jgi:hypothetical protein
MTFGLLEDLLDRDIRAAAQERFMRVLAVITVSHFEISFLSKNILGLWVSTQYSGKLLLQGGFPLPGTTRYGSGTAPLPTLR